MTIINTFLQKKKLRENNHGVFMVFAAYVLSFLLLIVGSDTLYNIKSKANGMIAQSDEVNQNSIIEEQYSYKVENRLDYRLKYQEMYRQATSIAETDQNEDGNTITLFSIPQEDMVTVTETLTQNDLSVAEMSREISQQMSQEMSNYITQDIAREIEVAKVSESSRVINATEEEITILEKIVEAEATGEDIIGKILVANVIINRTKDDEFPDKIKEVVFQKVGDDYQFSPIADKRYWSVKVTEETKEAVQRALNGEDHSKGALYFMARRLARKSSARWFDEKLKWLFKHGEHEFFR